MSKRSLFSLVGLSTILVANLLVVEQAEAGRFGGGRSFGSRPSYSQPYRQTPASPASPSSPSTPQQAPTAQPAPAAAAAAPARSGWMGALGGMLGGLAIGGLIGSLLSGHGFGGIGMLDILLFGLVAFLVYKLFANRRAQSTQAAPAGGMGSYRVPSDTVPEAQPAPVRRSSAPFDTDLMSRGTSSAHPASGASPGDIPEGVIAADFDREGFLTGAKNAYIRLQKAWDSGDLADIRQFTTDKVFAEVQEQMRDRPAGNRTDIVDLQAKLLEAGEEGGERVASVYFDAQLKEYHDGGAMIPDTVRAREVWYFVQPKFSRQPTWYLDGLRQVES